MSRSEQDRPFRNGAAPMGVPDPEVIASAGRRRFSRAYKLRILAEIEQCQRGEVGALLRREGLYSSTLSKWQQQAAGKLERPGPGGQQQGAGRGVKTAAARECLVAGRVGQGRSDHRGAKKLSALLETMQR